MIRVLITAFLVVITSVTILILRKKSPENLTPVYLLSITVKIFLSCCFVIWFILYDREAANSNVIFFLVAYVIFTAGEVIFLLVKKRA